MDLALHLPPDGPRGTRLLEALREAIVSGRLTAGERLPASRTLAAQLRLSRGTVVAAYEELVSEGYCHSRVGAGTFVTNLTPQPPSLGGRGSNGAHRTSAGLVPDHPGAERRLGVEIEARPPTNTSDPLLSREGGQGIRFSSWASRLREDAYAAPVPDPVRFDFRHGVTADVFPAALLAGALRRAALRLVRESGAGPPEGSARLRRALVSYLARARGLRAGPSQVVVVGGTQQGVDLATRLLLDPGDRVCLEDPSYPRARQVFEALGAELVPIPVDDSGMVADRLPAAGARMAYVTPSHQYPTGAVLSPHRRLALLAWAERHDAWVLEDDYDSEFRYTGPPLPCLQGLDRAGRCLYLGSLSKLLHPALRVGYLVLPPELVPAAVAAKRTLDQATPPIIQEALADLFESGEIERHLRRAARDYRARRARLLDACAKHLPAGVRVWPVTGGLHAYVELPRVDRESLMCEAARRGLALVDGAGFDIRPRPGATLALWFSRLSIEHIVPGIAALGEAVRATEKREEKGGDEKPQINADGHR